MRLLAALLLLLVLLPLGGEPAAKTVIPVAGLHAGGSILRDPQGIPHIIAANQHDLFLLQGWVHAEDRLFQMDVARRQASGTLAELMGSSTLAGDVEARTIGIRRAAERSLVLLSEPVRQILEAYSEGVNAYLTSHRLPPEYDGLELSSIPNWQPIDSVAIANAAAFQNSFDLDIAQTQSLFSYQAAGEANGFDGFALFTQDINRVQPFAPATTIPDASQLNAGAATSTVAEPAAVEPEQRKALTIRPGTLALAKSYIDRLRAVPFFQNAIDPEHRTSGSNEWVIHGQHTLDGHPLFANDPHLALRMPPIFHVVHLATRGMDVIGGSFPGTPFVVIGHNEFIAWGATSSLQDVTDTFQEQIVAAPNLPSGLRTIYRGIPEAVEALPQKFFFNLVGDGLTDNLAAAPPGGQVGNTSIPAAILIVPRRNNGPIVDLDRSKGIALSVQYTGFSGTRELDAFYTWNRARTLDEFRRGLQFFDVGSQNWAYADRQGNIAYFVGGEAPLREDLEAGTVAGLPPVFIRNGTGGNEWLPLTNPQPGQAVPFEIVPADEMPQIVNPPAGFFVNANNDPVGASLDNDLFNQFRPNGGISYLGFNYSSARAARITEMIRQKLDSGAKLSLDDMKAMQADTVLYDAQVFVPHLLMAYDNAVKAGADPVLSTEAAASGVAEAIERLRRWDFTSPTGIAEGYDAADADGNRLPPSPEEIDASVAATIYALWRAKMIAHTIDLPLHRFGLSGPSSRQALAALRHLLDNFDTNQGVGTSGIDFFKLDGVADAYTHRDILLLQSLGEALELLGSETFALVFGGSTNQANYPWGLLHRTILRHPLAGTLNVPPALGAFPSPLADQLGIPIDGGFETVDAAGHNVRASTPEDFNVGSGPVLRHVAELSPLGTRGEASLPGGESGVPGTPGYIGLLATWLTNDVFPLRDLGQAAKNAASVQVFVRQP